MAALSPSYLSSSSQSSSSNSLSSSSSSSSSPPTSARSNTTGSTAQRTESFQAVWKLYCKHCNVMWSCRGMEAVVMARPAIRCFSTDLPPLGCDIVCQPVAPPISEMIMDSGCSTCSSITHHARRFDLAPSGPCDCHVQDIACLGCGNIVGYYIHRPCFRCLAQRLRIKQRGFQHLWTFYQDNVVAVQRENEFGELVGWEELPVPPAPTATAIRPVVSENRYQRRISEVVGTEDDIARRSQRLMYVSQRVNAESILQNPRAGRDTRQNAARTLAALRQVDSNSIDAASLATTDATASSSVSSRDPTPARPSTRTVVMGQSPSSTPGSSGTVTPGATDSTLASTAAAAVAAAAVARRRDEVMEPLCPPKPKYGQIPPPA
ncbi:hypothetical protein FB639_005227, partial [Coemansia asiatica]